MSGGILILLCVLAFFIGTRARRSKPMDAKAKKSITKFKRFLLIVILGVTAFLFVVFLPALYEQIQIAIDTSFDWEILINVAIVILCVMVFISAFKKLKMKEQN